MNLLFTGSKSIFPALIIIISASFSFNIIALAQSNPFDVQFPIAELGNCGSMRECKIYCDDSVNARACTDWAMSKGFAQPAPKNEYREKSREAVEQREGPGGCRGQKECDTFCSQSKNGEECFNFAKEHNLMPPEEIRRIDKEIKEKVGPGGCRSRQECDAFCRKPDNNKTCLDFTVQEGKITREEADFMVQRTKMNQPTGGPRGPGGPRPPGKPQGPQINEEKAKQLLETVGGPGGCKTMDKCEAFCDASENDDACFNFAVEHGLMPPRELERMKKLKETQGPGGCVGRATCDAYCENIDHAEECMRFAVDQGFMNQSQVEEAKKFIEIGKRGGPGGCKGQRECDAFCGQPDHGEECFNFAKDNGLMPPEEIQRFEKERVIVKKLESQGGGPGGCRSQKECRQYCGDTSHFDECAAFSVKEGMMDVDKAKGMMKEFVDIEERKFDRFAPPGFIMASPKDFAPGQYNQPGKPGQPSWQPGPEGFGPPPGLEEKFNQRFESFEKHREEFIKRDDFCSNSENAEQCRGPMPNVPMMPPKRMMSPQEFPGKPGEFPPPQEFPGKPGEFPGAPGEFPAPQEFREFREGMMSPTERFMPSDGAPIQDQQQRLMPTIPGQMPTNFMPPAGIPTLPPEGIQAPIPSSPPPSEAPPSSRSKIQYLLGEILSPFMRILR